MYLDVLNYKNSITVNLSLIKLLGLTGAVYCSELFSLYSDIEEYDNPFVTVNRAHIAKKLDIAEAEQLAIENNLEKLDLLHRHPEDNNKVIINAKGFITMLAGNFTQADIDKVREVVRPQTKEEQAQIRRICVFNKIKEGVVCENATIKEFIYMWLDTLRDTSTINLSIKQAKAFISGVLTYAKDDVKVARAILEIAAKYHYIRCDEAVKVYEERKGRKKSNQALSHASVQKRATKKDMEGGEKF